MQVKPYEEMIEFMEKISSFIDSEELSVQRETFSLLTTKTSSVLAVLHWKERSLLSGTEKQRYRKHWKFWVLMTCVTPHDTQISTPSPIIHNHVFFSVHFQSWNLINLPLRFVCVFLASLLFFCCVLIFRKWFGFAFNFSLCFWVLQRPVMGMWFIYEED